jgi:hypothetical protein
MGGSEAGLEQELGDAELDFHVNVLRLFLRDFEEVRAVADAVMLAGEYLF